MSDLLFSDQTLPAFSKIKVEDINNAIASIIDKNKKNLKKIINKNNWHDFVEAMEEMSVKLANAWSPVSHLNAVVSTDELRKAYESALEQMVHYGLLIEQDDQIFAIYKSILENSQEHKLTDIQIQLLNHKIRDFKLSGVELDNEKKNTFKKLVTELSQHSTNYSNNILDSTDSWTYRVDDKEVLVGIPEDIISLAKNRAQKEHQDSWLFGLDAPTYQAIMKNAINRDLRKAFHYAYVTRASKKGPHDEKYDNSKEMFEILSKKHSQARLLGYKNYAEYSLVPKMVENTQTVLDFLYNILSKAKEGAKNEWEELKLFASRKDKITDLKPWDIAYYSELQKEKLFDLSDESLKPYFPLQKVLSGFFEILNKIYNVSFKQNKIAETWHEDVICYDVLDSLGNTTGHIYIDLYARLHKRSGAWMDECRVRCQTDNLQQLPVAFLTCNFTKPADNKPALLVHNDVVTLFHEFGHCLHHLLTQINYPSLSGINGVPWDAVELPSQFHENWCWMSESLPLISAHFETGDPLPEKYLKQLLKQKNYHSGLFLLRQLTFAIFDFKLHLEFHPDKGIAQIQQVLNKVREEVGIIPYAEYDQFQHSFSHIFAGGYSAGYYSYLWAEVLAANCFARFKEDGIFNNNTGQEFLDTILSKGGSIDFNTATKKFCGDEIRIEPLLESHGILV